MLMDINCLIVLERLDDGCLYYYYRVMSCPIMSMSDIDPAPLYMNGMMVLVGFFDSDSKQNSVLTNVVRAIGLTHSLLPTTTSLRPPLASSFPSVNGIDMTRGGMN